MKDATEENIPIERHNTEMFQLNKRIAVLENENDMLRLALAKAEVDARVTITGSSANATGPILWANDMSHTSNDTNTRARDRAEIWQLVCAMKSNSAMDYSPDGIVIDAIKIHAVFTASREERNEQA